MKCWGWNVAGQLGNGTVSDSSVAQTVAGDGGDISASAITVSGAHSCAVRASSRVACWGGNFKGELGDGTHTNRSLPTAVPDFTGAVTIAAGLQHTCATTADGSAWCWGESESGQLGDGTNTDQLLAAMVTGLTHAVAVSVGSFHSCALLGDGSGRCWRANHFGQVGDGSTIDRALPVPVTGLTNAVAIAAGNFHTCALLADGTARCWGSNSGGGLGDGTSTDRSVPTPVTGLANAVALAGGSGHTCALLVDGTVRCWGANGDGQLGNGTIGGFLSVPNTVVGLTNAIAITAGAFHTCALLANGGARCWGANTFGQLGTGDNSSQPLPSVVSSLFDTFAITAGQTHTCAIKSTGAVLCWGFNLLGQLGDGTDDDSPIPVAVPSFTLNIDPAITLKRTGHGSAVVLNIIASCEDGDRLQVRVTLTQGAASGHGSGHFECTGGLTRFPVDIHANGHRRFSAGPARAEAEADIKDHGLVDHQEWNRNVEIVIPVEDGRKDRAALD